MSKKSTTAAPGDEGGGPEFQKAGPGALPLPHPKLFVVPPSGGPGEGEGKLQAEKFPADFKKALELLKTVSVEKQSKSRDARLKALGAHVILLQNGTPAPTQDATYLRKVFSKQTELGRASRLANLATQNEDVAWLLDQVKKPAKKS